MAGSQHGVPLGGPTLSGVGDEEFADYIASRLAGLRGVAAVSLGGSRASGTSRPDSDWDFAVYYRGRFDPDDLSVLAPSTESALTLVTCYPFYLVGPAPRRFVVHAHQNKPEQISRMGTGNQPE